MTREEYQKLVEEMNDGQFPTPSLDVYRDAVEFDNNFSWRIPHGHLVNFLDQALERLSHAIIMQDLPKQHRVPPRPKRELELDAIAEQLKKLPGEWSLVEQATWASHTESYRRRGLDTRVRKAANNKWDVYARYPEEVPSESAD